MPQTGKYNSELSFEDFIAFRDFIHEKSGIYFAENKKYLVENRLSQRMTTLGMASYRDYLYLVKYDASLREFNMLMNLVTTNETSFYRNPPQLSCFREETLPQVIERKTKMRQPRKLRIWSAGCSTGEEPYTLGMILLEVLGESSHWYLEIVANDISESVLYSARKACYSEMSLRTTPLHVINKYFVKREQKYFVTENVKRLVKFTHLNLVDRRRMALMTDIDFVFCRNVMIYFSDEAKRQIVKGFYNSLTPGGYMFIDHAESLHGISKAFKLVYLKNGLVYCKEGSVPAEDQLTTKPLAISAMPVAPKVDSGTESSSAPLRGGSRCTLTYANASDRLRKIQELLASSRRDNLIKERAGV